MNCLSSILIPLLLLTSVTLSAQEKNYPPLVSDINAKVENLLPVLPLCDSLQVDIFDESTEGGQAVGYFQKGQLVFMKVALFGETMRREMDCYYTNGRLAYVRDQEHQYNRPIYWDEQEAKAAGDTEHFDPEKTRIITDRYYFSGPRLSVWINNAGETPDLSLGTNSLLGRGLDAFLNPLVEQLTD